MHVMGEKRDAVTLAGFPLVNILEPKERRAPRHPSKSARLWWPSSSAINIVLPALTL